MHNFYCFRMTALALPVWIISGPEQTTDGKWLSNAKEQSRVVGVNEEVHRYPLPRCWRASVILHCNCISREKEPVVFNHVKWRYQVINEKRHFHRFMEHIPHPTWSTKIFMNYKSSQKKGNNILYKSFTKFYSAILANSSINVSGPETCPLSQSKRCFMEKIERERAVRSHPGEFYQRITEEKWKRLTLYMMKVIDSICFAHSFSQLLWTISQNNQLLVDFVCTL